jgi:hypothetical protein
MSPMNIMNQPFIAGADDTYTLYRSQGGPIGVGIGMVDLQALKSQVMLLVQKVEGYEKEVKQLRMRQEEMEKYVRRLEERLKRDGERYCFGC